MEEDGENLQKVEGRAVGVQIFLLSCGAGGVALWRGDMGGHPLHGQGPGRCSKTRWSTV